MESLIILDVILEVVISFVLIGNFDLLAGVPPMKSLGPFHTSTSLLISFENFVVTACCQDVVSISLIVSFLCLTHSLLLRCLGSIRLPTYSCDMTSRSSWL